MTVTVTSPKLRRLSIELFEQADDSLFDRMTDFTSSVRKDHHNKIGKAAEFLSTLFTSTEQLRFQITVAILVFYDGICRWD